MINENLLHGRGIGSTRGGIALKIDKKVEVAGVLKACIYLTMDAQLNIQNGLFDSTVYQEMLHMLEPLTALFVALTVVRKMHLALGSLKREYLNYFDLELVLD